MSLGLGDTPLEINVPTQRIVDLLITALEQGSGYWCRLLSGSIHGLLDDKKMQFAELADESVDPDDLSGCPQHSLSWDAVIIGLKRMAAEEPRHFANWLAEEDDSITADVALQMMLLGEVRYG